MARVHGEFLNDDSDTDVITFQHGEILVCPEVARRQARQHDRTTGEEVALYAIHGILHLLGFDHEKKTGAAHMERMQEKLLAASRSSRR
jgi:probable rRNA maturation factor